MEITTSITWIVMVLIATLWHLLRCGNTDAMAYSTVVMPVLDLILLLLFVVLLLLFEGSIYHIIVIVDHAFIRTSGRWKGLKAEHPSLCALAILIVTTVRYL
jgi:hypothetical protein